MKNVLSIILISLFAAANVFAFEPFVPNTDEAKKITEKLESAKQISEKQQKAQYLTGVVLEGSFSKEQLSGGKQVTLKKGMLDVTFYVEPAKNSKYGDIMYKAVKNGKFDSLEFNMETAKIKAPSDPHAPVDVFLTVSAIKKGKEAQNGKVLLMSVEALSIYSLEPSSYTPKRCADAVCANSEKSAKK
jgi:hypothetical protein